MCMGCGLIDHNGEKREYARNSGNSQPSMRNAYSSTESYTTKTNNEHQSRNY